MADKVEIQTSIGTFELIKPKAGVRNRAMMRAETDSGNIKKVVFMTELLPKIINKRPEGCDKDVPIEQLLDSLSIEDYDALVSSVDHLITNQNAETEKKK
jgi:hypothetical protein